MLSKREMMDNRIDPQQTTSNLWFALTLVYIIFDYGRPQAVIPVIGHIRPLLIIIVLLSLFLLRAGSGFKLQVRQIKLMWLFVFLLACYVPFARNNYYAYKTTLSQSLYMPFILSVIFCVDSISRLKKIVFVFICLMIYIAAYSVLHGGKGPGNYFGDENDLSLYINMWLPFCYFLFFAEKSVKSRLTYVIGLITGLSAVVVSFSRGGFVGLVAMAGVAWWFSRKKVVTLMVFALIMLVLFLCVDTAYWEEISTVTDTSDHTASERIKSWATAWDMFLDNPFGVGGNNFQVRFMEYQGDRFARGMWGRVAHSLWFTLIPELGFVGIYLYFSLLHANLKDIFWLMKQQRDCENDEQKYFHFLGVSFLASAAGYFASATFISVLYYAHYWYLTALIVAAVRVVKMPLKVVEVRDEVLGNNYKTADLTRK